MTTSSRLRPLLAALWFFFQHCRTLDYSVLPWRLDRDGRNEITGHSWLMECEILNISLASETSNTSRSDASCYVFALEPEGNVAMPFVGYEPSSLCWTVRRPAGTQLFVALFDSSGTSFGVLPHIYAVIPNLEHCLARPESPGVLEATELEITRPVFDCHVLCGPRETSHSGWKLPHSVIVVAFDACDYTVIFGSCILPCGRGKGLPGIRVVFQISALTVIVVASNGNGMSTMSSLIHRDTPSVGTSEPISRCRSPQPRDVTSRFCEPPRPTAFRFHRSLSDHPSMQLNRNLSRIDPDYGNTVAVAVGVSLGGTGFVAMVILVIIKYRRWQKILDAQDTLPRPFEITVPAATTTGTSKIMPDLTSTPPPTISPQKVCSQSGRSSRHDTRREETFTRGRLQRSGSAPAPTITTLSQCQPCSSCGAHQPHHLSDMSLLPHRTGPSAYRPLPHSRTPPSHTPTPPSPSSRSSSHVHLGQSSPPNATTPHRPRRQPRAPVNRSVSLEERRSAKHALLLSRSASELYRATSSRPRYHTSECGSGVLSGKHGHRRGCHCDAHELRVDTFRPTNHLRQWHSASPVVHVHHVGSEGLEEDVGGTIIIQHQDAGMMQELPPPYHKLV